MKPLNISYLTLFDQTPDRNKHSAGTNLEPRHQPDVSDMMQKNRKDYASQVQLLALRKVPELES
eukprot:1161197-Pelagomonas_calceolata.AAC.3